MNLHGINGFTPSKNENKSIINNFFENFDKFVTKAEQVHAPAAVAASDRAWKRRLAREPAQPA